MKTFTIIFTLFLIVIFNGCTYSSRVDNTRGRATVYDDPNEHGPRGLPPAQKHG